MKNFSNIWANLGLIFILAGAFWVCAQKPAPVIETRLMDAFTWCRPAPEVVTGSYVYRSAQPSLLQLDSALRTGEISTVLRLNGDGKDSRGVRLQDERALCEKHGVEFVYLNIEGKANMLSGNDLEAAAAILDGGEVLVHCRSGFDRTGAVIGYWLRQNGYDHDEIIQHNEWQAYEDRKGRAYRRYLHALEP